MSKRDFDEKKPDSKVNTELPLLRLFTDGTTNYISWRKKLASMAIEKYGMAGALISTGAYQEFELPKPEYPRDPNDRVEESTRRNCLYLWESTTLRSRP
jgi:hypothetical protein